MEADRNIHDYFGVVESCFRRDDREKTRCTQRDRSGGDRLANIIMSLFGRSRLDTRNKPTNQVVNFILKLNNGFVRCYVGQEMAPATFYFVSFNNTEAETVNTGAELLVEMLRDDVLKSEDIPVPERWEYKDEDGKNQPLVVVYCTNISKGVNAKGSKKPHLTHICGLCFEPTNMINGKLSGNLYPVITEIANPEYKKRLQGL